MDGRHPQDALETRSSPSLSLHFLLTLIIERQQVGPLTHVIAQEHVATMGTRQCAIMLPVPSEAPHQLQLNLVSLTWELRVEFVAAMHALDRIEDTRVDLTPQSTRTIHLNLIPPHSWPSSSEARLEHAAGRATATPGAI